MGGRPLPTLRLRLRLSVGGSRSAVQPRFPALCRLLLLRLSWLQILRSVLRLVRVLRVPFRLVPATRGGRGLSRTLRTHQRESPGVRTLPIPRRLSRRSALSRIARLRRLAQQRTPGIAGDVRSRQGLQAPSVVACVSRTWKGSRSGNEAQARGPRRRSIVRVHRRTDAMHAKRLWCAVLAAALTLCAGPAAAALGVEVWTDKGSDAVYEPGDLLEVNVRSTDDSYLMVYEIDAEGAVNLL